MPPEIKEKIYDHAMRRIHQTGLKIPVDKMSWSGMRGLNSHLTAMCLKNKLEYTIAVPVFIRRAIFQISRQADAGMLAWYMHEMERNRVSAIRLSEEWKLPTSPTGALGPPRSVRLSLSWRGTQA
jgi:hypothetical protein